MAKKMEMEAPRIMPRSMACKTGLLDTIHSKRRQGRGTGFSGRHRVQIRSQGHLGLLDICEQNVGGLGLTQEREWGQGHKFGHMKHNNVSYRSRCYWPRFQNVTESSQVFLPLEGQQAQPATCFLSLSSPPSSLRRPSLQ